MKEYIDVVNCRGSQSTWFAIQAITEHGNYDFENITRKEGEDGKIEVCLLVGGQQVPFQKTIDHYFDRLEELAEDKAKEMLKEMDPEVRCDNALIKLADILEDAVYKSQGEALADPSGS